MLGGFLGFSHTEHSDDLQILSALYEKCLKDCRTRDSKMRVLAQTTTFVARQRNRWKLVISLFTLSPTICYPNL